ncbi:MAG: S41 family peptidase [Acidobacteria bacterium]|nr:S41 family peptidase [Acidobacteriota bacterium]
MQRYRSLSAATFAVVVSALVGGSFGRSALATQSSQDKVSRHYKVFTAALVAIESQYVDKVESDRLVYGGINGMLQTLDPHSTFFDPRAYAQLRERQEGRYYGLGITIQVVDGDITVVNLFEGSPAYKQGIRRGDVIATVEGESAKGWTSEQAVRRLRGPKGTSVRIAIRRRGYEQLIDLSVERDEINIPTILGAFMVDSTTGYVRLRDFSEATDRDLSQSLQELASQGMRRLVLDLRDNPGGPLDQAIRVSNRFLPKGDLIVYTRGRIANSDQDYRATEESEFVDLPLIVLVNRNSASASEIVTGAIQDHDRGLIVGETTFGKALVQSIYRISEGAGVALTTARYYTPSGRLIQRPWDGSFDEYLSYTLRDQEPERPHTGAQVKYTDAGRKVYGGGGIEPDKYMAGPVEGFNPTRFGRLLYARQAFERYAEKFSARGDDRIKGEGRNRRIVEHGFAVDDAMVADFKDQVKLDRVNVDDQSFKQNDAFIRAMIRYQINLALFGVDEARRLLISQDPQAQFALSLFPEADKLSQMARAKAQPAARR